VKKSNTESTEVKKSAVIVMEQAEGWLWFRWSFLKRQNSLTKRLSH